MKTTRPALIEELRLAREQYRPAQAHCEDCGKLTADDLPVVSLPHMDLRCEWELVDVQMISFHSDRLITYPGHWYARIWPGEHEYGVFLPRGCKR